MKNPAVLDLSQRTLINKYLQDYPPEVSEHTFTNLFAWLTTKPVWLYETENTAVFLTRNTMCREDELLILGPPAGELPLVEVFQELGDKVIGAVRMGEKSVRDLSTDIFTITEDRDNWDYIYLVTDLAELSGRNYSKKRNHVKHCLEEYDCIFEPVTDRNLPECRDLLDRWCRSRRCAEDPGLHGESEAIKRTLDHFSDFNLLGGAIRVDDVIQAFAFGERLNRDTAVCHFEKAMPEINGLSQLINHWFAKHCLVGFKYVNREQDLGIPGLRQAKESYHPDHMIPKFKVLRKSAGDRREIKPIPQI